MECLYGVAVNSFVDHALRCSLPIRFICFKHTLSLSLSLSLSIPISIDWRVVERNKVHTLFTAPTALRAIRQQDPTAALAANHDLSSLRALFVAGERGDPPTINFYTEALKKPVLDHFWQTEVGWPMAVRANVDEGIE